MTLQKPGRNPAFFFSRFFRNLSLANGMMNARFTVAVSKRQLVDMCIIINRLCIVHPQQKDQIAYAKQS